MMKKRKNLPAEEVGPHRDPDQEGGTSLAYEEDREVLHVPPEEGGLCLKFPVPAVLEGPEPH